MSSPVVVPLDNGILTFPGRRHNDRLPGNISAGL